MDPTSREDLSALMDGELAAEPTRFLLRRLDHDPELGATWSRWHLIRACLASDPARLQGPALGNDFASRVAAAVQVEAPRGRQRRWARYMGGGAIAAGVAVAALMLNTPNPRVGAPAPVTQSRTAPASAAATALAEAAPAGNQLTPPWLLSRQPTVLPVQTASANVVYGTGLMQPDYLRRATYARDAAFLTPSFQANPSELPIVLLPESPPASSSTARH
ncbi:MAG TPA: sigma-E factor negative regulatory protein [Rhodanobacteraceae bacterium]|nr:sigma-E factor negative regulatory protein [Rhodanobacteraceae bacterium]